MDRQLAKNLIRSIGEEYGYEVSGNETDAEFDVYLAREGANKRGNSSRLTQSFHFFMFEPFFLP